MDFETAREQFPALKEKVFLDAACVSLAPRVATEAVQRFLDVALHCPARSATLQHIAMDELRADARCQAARLINAQEDEIALVESTTHGLSLAARSISLQRGDRVLLADLEFIQVAVPWCQRREEQGIEIDLVPNRQGRIEIEEVAARIGPRTKVLALSSVQWCNGFRSDLKALSALCREREIWLVVDAVQQLGALPLNVQETPVDFLACGAHKWLNSPFGAGFLYVRRAAMERLHPPLAGYLSVETPPGNWAEYFQTPSTTPVQSYRIVNQGRRFEIGGTANYPGAIALAASLKMINGLGSEPIARRIYELTDYLLAGLERLGVEIVSPQAPESRSGIVTFNLGSSTRNAELMDFLLDHQVLVSVRYTSGVGGVRVSCHFYNSRDDLDRLLELTRRFRRS